MSAPHPGISCPGCRDHTHHPLRKNLKLSLQCLWQLCVQNDTSGEGATTYRNLGHGERIPVALRRKNWGLILLNESQIPENKFAAILSLWSWKCHRRHPFLPWLSPCLNCLRYTKCGYLKGQTWTKQLLCLSYEERVLVFKLFKLLKFAFSLSTFKNSRQ